MSRRVPNDRPHVNIGFGYEMRTETENIFHVDKGGPRKQRDGSLRSDDVHGICCRYKALLIYDNYA